MTIAVDKPKKDAGADFIRVTVWGAQAENCNKWLTKGRQVAVSGRIQTGSYKDRNGQTVYTTDVVADRVEFIGEKGENSRSDGRKYESGGTYQPEPQNANYGGFSTMNEPVPF